MEATSDTSPEQRLMAAVRDYLGRGWRVIPLHTPKPDGTCTCGKQECGAAGKHPRTKNGLKDSTSRVPVAQEWWRKWPRANIGIVTGGKSGLLALDIDTRHGGYDSLTTLQERYGPLPATLTALTGGGGEHRLFAHPGGDVLLRNMAGLDGLPGLDVRGDGGYIVAAPSLHNSGAYYDWQDAASAIAPLPEWLLSLLTKPRGTSTYTSGETPRDSKHDSGAKWLADALTRTGPGTGDQWGYWLAQQLLCGQVPQPESVLMTYARAATVDPRHPFTERDVTRWLRSAGESEIVKRGQPAKSQTARPNPRPERRSPRQPNEPGPIPFPRRRQQEDQRTPPPPDDDQPPPPPPTDQPDAAEHHTDMGNARRFVRLHGENVRYVAVWGQWLIWDGKRWRKDETNHIERLAKATVKAMWHEIASIDDADEREAAIKWIYKSESAARLQAMLDVAKSESEIAAHHSAFDANPWLLNVLNGTLDLHTGALRPHRQADLLTKLAPVQYDANAHLPLWDKFLSTVTNGNAELAAFLRRAVGYTLTGDTGEEKLFFAHGPERTGKSTFFEAIKATMGDYAQTADFETFIARPQVGGIRNDVADLVGARMVASIEVDDGKRLAAGLVKTITGGDTIKARHLYKEAFAFRPDFKLWLAANDEPRVDASDGAMWSRILRIKFDATITKKDPRVKATLRNPAKAGPAILAWAMRGCLEWQQSGLGVPEAVTEATNEYRQSMDPLRDFITDCCELEEGAWCSASALREVYEKWCKANGERYPLSGKRFGDALARRGCASELRRLGQLVTRGWKGVRIAAEI